MKKSNFIKSTIIVTVATLCARLLGVVRESVLAWIYGAGSVSDAFVTAFTMPNIILTCIGSSLGMVFIPLYYENKSNGNKFTSNIINIALVLGFALTLFFCLFPGILVSLFVSGFDDYTYQLTVRFTRIMMLSTIPILLFNVLKAYLQMYQAFFFATALDALINVFVILGIMTSKSTGILSVMGIATVIGNFVCFFGLIGSCYKHGFRYNFYINFRDKNVKKMLYLIIPVFIGMVVAELNTIIDRNFASSLATGTVSAMNYATKINGILYSLLSTSVVTVMYPEIVRLVADSKENEVKECINKFILILGYIILPLSLFIIAYAEPIVVILFQRGSFSKENTLMTAQCVRIYAISYLTTNLNPILNRIFYAYNNTKTPTINAILAVVINIALNFILIGRFQHRGLAFSTSVASIFTTALLLYSLQRRIGGLKLRKLSLDLFKMVVACCVMFAVQMFGQKMFANTLNTAIENLIYLFVMTIISALIYVGCTILLKVKTMIMITELLKKRRH